MKKIFVIAGSLHVMCAPGTLAVAADLPVATHAVESWTGGYLGIHAGYGGGGLGPNTNALPNLGTFFSPSVTGLIGGYQIGYLRKLPSNLVVGAEASMTYVSPVDQAKLVPAPFNTTVEYIATLRGRFGYAFGDVLPYVTGGVAFAGSRLDVNGPDGDVLSSRRQIHTGWTAGAGVEFMLGDGWSARGEYSVTDLASRTYSPSDFALRDVTVTPRIHALRFGLNYRLWDEAPADGGLSIRQPHSFPPQYANWNLHGDTTLLVQGYGRIRAPYGTAYSLPGGGQARETWTSTALLGVRLWDGGELYINGALDQGFGLNGSTGIAGFPNGEAQKGGADIPRFRAQRYFLRQTFGFGGGEETVEDGPNQLGGKRDIDRLTVTVGRFAVTDFFDNNTYAKDPRNDFMNWSIWASGAYDFPADLPGLTRGAVAEFNRRDWTLRAGLFQVPTAPNSDVFSSQGGGAVLEWEQRYAMFGQPGKFRIGAFANRGNTANYRDVIGIASENPAIPINDAVLATRKLRPKYGAYANMEQAITENVGIFARASWNDGQNETLSFTDIDRSLSGGVSIKGSGWGRPEDTVGIAGAINGLSSAHRDFLGAGGIGLLIGDGRINYRHEKIFEAYYAYKVDKWTTVTLDYQFIANPAYNADRGPVSVASIRAHAAF